MRNFIYICVGFCAVFFFTSVAFAAMDPAAVAMQKRYAAMQSMRVEFSQTLTHKESGNVEKRAGVLLFAKPLNVVWETKSPIPELLVITPEAVWNAFPDEDMAYKYPPNISESESIVRVITGQSALDKDFFVESKKAEKGMTRLALYPKNPTQSMTEAELLVDAKTGLIHSAKIIDFYNNINDLVFTAQDLDAKLPDSAFVFTPAKGMKVEDRTKSGTAPTPLTR
ncbi:outer membrane lipoprotein carrier protein LolA [Desulfovibrio sp. OttesenSCG-928-O18]|nr:outer membrane lipoprotein carrier protein LolA [Desulfovibrio sp. OttesenSCG-928-O18]